MSDSIPTGPEIDPTATSDDRIIQAALVLISVHGLGGVTMSKVADTAGVSRQTLYNHYPNIDGIVAEAMRRHSQQSIELLEAALQIADSPMEKLEQLVRHVVSVSAHAHHAPDYRSGLSAQARATLDIYQEAVEEHIRAIIEDGRQVGAFRPDLTVAIDTILIRAMLDGTSELVARAPADAAQIGTAATRTILTAVESTEPAGPHGQRLSGAPG